MAAKTARPATGDRGPRAEFLDGSEPSKDNLPNHRTQVAQHHARSALARQRSQRVAEAIHKLGARALDELLLEIGQRTGEEDLVAEIAAGYAEINIEILRALGGHQFPASPIRLVKPTV